MAQPEGMAALPAIAMAFPSVVAPGCGGVVHGGWRVRLGDLATRTAQGVHAQPPHRCRIARTRCQRKRMALVYRARGMSPDEANAKADGVLRSPRRDGTGEIAQGVDGRLLARQRRLDQIVVSSGNRTRALTQSRGLAPCSTRARHSARPVRSRAR